MKDRENKQGYYEFLRLKKYSSLSVYVFQVEY